MPADVGWHLTEMFEAMGRGELRALYVLGENTGWHAVDERSPEPHRGEAPGEAPEVSRRLAEQGADREVEREEHARPGVRG